MLALYSPRKKLVLLITAEVKAVALLNCGASEAMVGVGVTMTVKVVHIVGVAASARLARLTRHREVCDRLIMMLFRHASAPLRSCCRQRRAETERQKIHEHFVRKLLKLRQAAAPGVYRTCHWETDGKLSGPGLPPRCTFPL